MKKFNNFITGFFIAGILFIGTGQLYSATLPNYISESSVNEIYRAVLGREVTTEEYNTDKDKPLDQIFSDLKSSQEYQTEKRRFVNESFKFHLGRNVDTTGLNFWSNRYSLETFRGIISSQEYVLKAKPNDYTIGSENPEIIIVTYGDLDCPYCANFHQTMDGILAKYPNKVQWIFRNFPLKTLHPNSYKKAEVLECSGEQGKFWDMLDLAYKNQSITDLKTIANQVGIDNDLLDKCLGSEKFKMKIEDQMEDAKAIGVNGTPGNYMIGVSNQNEIFEIPGAIPFETMDEAISTYLEIT